MSATLHAPGRLVKTIAVGLLVGSTSATAQVPTRATCQSPAASDVDPQLTKLLQRREQDFADAILHRDANALERIVAPQYALRIADVPQGSMPRSMWVANTLERLKAEWAELTHCAARKLTTDLAVVSLIFSQKGSMDGRDFSGEFYVVDLWQQNAGEWQIIARYSSPLGTRPDRGTRPVPPAADVDRQLTDSLSQLEQRLGDVAQHGFTDAQQMQQLVGSEFTLRTSDAPDRSLPRALWGQPASTYKLESLDEHYHAARRLANDLAVVSFLLTQKASRDGHDRSGDFYVVDVWKHRDGRWQLIARYSSPQGKSFDRPPTT